MNTSALTQAGIGWSRLADGVVAHASAVETLADGRLVRIRTMQADDSDAERGLIDGLSRQSRYQRFQYGMPTLPASLLQRLTADVDQRRHVALVAEAVDAAPGEGLVGDARYVRNNDGDDAEFALTVTDAWQGVGLGRLLLEHLRRDARAQGLATLYGDVLWGNAGMLGLARSVGARLRRHPGDATLVRFELPL